LEKDADLKTVLFSVKQK